MCVIHCIMHKQKCSFQKFNQVIMFGAFCYAYRYRRRFCTIMSWVNLRKCSQETVTCNTFKKN